MIILIPIVSIQNRYRIGISGHRQIASYQPWCISPVSGRSVQFYVSNATYFVNPILRMPIRHQNVGAIS